MPLERLHAPAQIRRFPDQMHVIFHHEIGIYPQLLILPAPPKAIQEDLTCIGPDEYRNPLDDGRGEEVDAFGFD